MSDVSGDADKLGSPAMRSFDVEHWYAAREALTRLYGVAPGFSTLMGEIARSVADASAARRAELRAGDARRRADPRWFARSGRPAYCAYVDRFAGTWAGCREHIAYLRDLNVGLVHLLPPANAQGGDNDGDPVWPGFAVDDVRTLASALRRADIGLVVGLSCEGLNTVDSRGFRLMLDAWLGLANAGVDGFRLMNSGNMPQAHDITSALRHLVAMVAPGALLLAEVARDPGDDIAVFGADAAPAGHLACNTTAMAGLWAAIAEGDGAIFDDALRAAAAKPAHGLWLNAARSGDDLVWGALDRSAGKERRQAWTRFYAGGESFAEGLAFQAGTDDVASVCGMAASLCGVTDDAFGLDRLKLVYSVVYALDGVPMIYMGDEIALPNDADFAGDGPDMRRLHQPRMDWETVEAASSPSTPQGEMLAHLRMLSEILMAVPGMAEAGPATPLAGRAGPVLAFTRALPKGRFLCLANLSDEAREVRLIRPATELFYGVRMGGDTTIPPWTALWLHEV